MHDALSAIDTIDELVQLVREHDQIYLRYSEGPDHDADQQSIDTESGLALPGLSVNPLTPESWWTRPLAHWLARQVCQYKDLCEKNPRRYAWALTGTVVARGPDCEPLLVDVVPRARLTNAMLLEAQQLYRAHFDAGRGPEDSHGSE